VATWLRAGLLAAVVLVGPLTDVAGAQTTTVQPPDTLEPSETTAPAADEDGEDDFDEGLSAGTVVLLVVVGLVTVAVALSLLTWRYWRATSPSRQPSGRV
jgi:hypothetical protein